MALTNILITEAKNGGRSMILPQFVEKIQFSSNGTRFITYDILDKGEVNIPNGINSGIFKWDGTLPGEKRQSGYMGKSVNNKEVQSIWSEWRAYGTPLLLYVSNTPIFHPVYLKTYDVSYAGGMGDYDYSIEFIVRQSIKVTSKKIEIQQQPTVRDTPKTTTYVVKSGDNLWDIARRLLGNGTRNSEIYELNKDAIESTARKYGKSSSNNGWWIYPGTTLHIPEA